MAINEKELNEVSGGYGNWQQYAKGSYVNYGQYIVYTVTRSSAATSSPASRSASVSLCSRSASGTTSRTPTSSTSTRS